MISTTAISMIFRQTKKATLVNTVSRLGLPMCLAGCLAITGCNGVEQKAAMESEGTTSDTAIAVEESPDNTEKTSTQVADEPNKETDAKIEQPKAVEYDVSSWSTLKEGEGEEAPRLNIDDLEAMQKIFGKVTMTDENSLDYASNTAIKYRFMEGDKPYLDIIDSQEYLEFGWYYANPNDSDKEKELSVSHAKKVYEVAQNLMGADGAKLVESMLNNQITKNKSVGGQEVALAKCEFYSCMLILQKPNS